MSTTAREADIHPAVAGAQPFMRAERQGPGSRDDALFDSDDGKARLEKVLSRYPTRRAALLPLLNYAQASNGWVSQAAMREIADVLELTPAYVRSVATFYTMYNRHPVGRYLVQVCTNISCDLCGGQEVLRRFLEETDTRLGETSEDRLFTVMEVECLGACGFATVVQVNDEYVENVEPGDVSELVQRLRDADPEVGAASVAGEVRSAGGAGEPPGGRGANH